MKLLFALALFVGAGAASAQDALAGKRLYFDAGRIRSAGSSCVDCHYELPGAYAIGAAANDPGRIQRAVESIPQMSIFRGRLTAADYVDLAAYIGRPDVPSPALRATTSGTQSEVIAFGTLSSGSGTSSAQFRLSNTGQLALQITSVARIVGENASDFNVVSSNCAGTLTPGTTCIIDVRFAPPAGASGERRAALQIDHDWIGGLAAVALLGGAQPQGGGSAPPIGGGGGALSLGLLALLPAALVLRRSLRVSARARRAATID